MAAPTRSEARYQWPRSLTADRIRFLWTVSGSAPEVLKDLKEKVASAASDERDTALREWSSRWNLTAPWIVAVARKTVNVMSDEEQWERHCCISRRNKECAEDPRYGGYERPYNPNWTWVTEIRVGLDHFGLVDWIRARNEDALQVLYRPADPTRETFDDFRDAALTFFEAELRAHWDARRLAIEANGAVPAPPKKRGEAAWAHFEWFVRFQVLEHTQAEIAASIRLSEKTVQLACRDISERIRLERRS